MVKKQAARSKAPKHAIEAVAAHLAPQHPFLIVGVGASAGGMEAFGQLLNHLPADSGAAYVLVQHLAPDHDSILAELLSRKTTMPVREATDGVKIEPNQVWVIPPATEISLTDGHLHLSARQRGSLHMPVDIFLRTLAEVQGPLSIGVVLSGTGTYGTLGVREVRAAGGIAIAQDPESAKYDGMPRSAATAGGADLVLPPAAIAAEIARLSRDPYARPPAAAARPEIDQPDVDGLRKILALLRRATGTDFQGYKKPTLLRRIQRRMALLRIETLPDYAELLARDAEEIAALSHDVLIKVTSFFRDPGCYRALGANVLPRLLAERNPNTPLRVWVPGCATGEEAYSLAISILECAGDGIERPEAQIFGTDLSARSIEYARAGLYPPNVVADLAPERLARFFVKTDHGYQVNKSVRDLCIFAPQDLTRDPPFSRLDLIACRNVLIYLEPAVQRRVLANFHYALNANGVLVLGASESAGSAADLFTLIDRENRIFQPASGALRPPLGFVARGAEVDRDAESAPLPLPEVRTLTQRQAHRILLSRYGPPGVLIGPQLQVLEFHGDTSRYLRHAHGEASLGLYDLIRRDLLADTRKAIEQALAADLPVRHEGIRLRPTDTGLGDRASAGTVTLEVIPIRTPGARNERAFLVLFEEQGTADASQRPPAPPRQLQSFEPDLSRRIAELEQELAATRLYLQTSSEEHEAANEELQSANEEVLSSNEELQSINEEMETAKEELQSANEELTTVNDELNSRNRELGRLGDDLENILTSVGMPILVLGPDLRIRRFTAPAAQLFNLIPGDLDRPLREIRPNLEAPELERWIAQAIASVQPAEHECRDHQGRALLLRVRPYRSKDNRIDGAVVAVVDIDAMKAARARAERARDLSDAIVATIAQPLLLLDHDLRVVHANPAFYSCFATDPASVLGRRLFEISGGSWDDPGLRGELERIPAAGQPPSVFSFAPNFPGLGERALEVRALRLELGPGGTQAVVLAIDDRTTVFKLLADAGQHLDSVRTAQLQAEVANQLKDDFIATVSHELRGPLNAMLGWTHLLSGGELDAASSARALQAIDRSVKAQSRLIEDLLDVSRVMSGKLTLKLRSVELLELVQAVLENARAAAAAKQIELALDLRSTPERVNGDPDRLQQVIWNLVSNAIKFTPRGGRVEVSLERAGNNVVFQVRDSGRGIAPDFLPFIFDRFRQAEGTHSRKEPGLGLGLAIVRQLTEMHGGLVEAHSGGKDQGATFTVSLPVPPLRMQRPALEREPEEDERAGAVAPAADPEALAGLRILVVEDDPEGRDMLQAVLTAWGASVTAASSAATALASLAERVPDLVLSDIGMPGEDGCDFLRRVRARPADLGGNVPALALTAYATEKDRACVTDAGFQGHLIKPVTPAELVATIRSLLERATR